VTGTDNSPAESPEEALRWAVQSQRALAFNLGYLDFPVADDEIPDMPWQMLSQLHEVEYTLLNDFVVARIAAGELRATVQWNTRPPEDQQ